MAARPESQFWLRSNWIISKVVRWSAGPIIITEGKYKNPNSTKKGAPPTSFILIFTKLDDEQYDPAKPLDNDTRLPHGLAIPAQHWEDIKRAFGRYVMFKDSRCKDEIDQFFMFTAGDYKTDKMWYDCDRADRSNSPHCDNDKLDYSQKKANFIAEALRDFPAYGAVDERMSESGSLKGEKKKKKKKPAPEPDSDAATEILSESDTDEAIEAAVRAQVLKIREKKAAKKAEAKGQKRSYTDVLMASKKVS